MTSADMEMKMVQQSTVPFDLRRSKQSPSKQRYAQVYIVLARNDSPLQSITRIIRNAPADHLKASQVRKAVVRTTFTNSKLPAGSLQRFTSDFVPLWRDYTGTLRNPWVTTDPAILKEMQTIWDIVFPDIKHVVTRTDAVYHLVRVCVSIFRF
jgi:hypothetical protein